MEGRLVRHSIAVGLIGAAILLVGVVPAAAEPWPVRSLSIFARTAVGLTKTGPFTLPTKEVGFGKSVTWRFATDPDLAWNSLTVERAEKRSDGTWGPFTAIDRVVVDDTGVAYYAMSSAHPLTVSIRAFLPAGGLTTADSHSPTEEAVWMASPPRPLSLTAGTALGASTSFTASTKVAGLGQTVTWRWVGPASLAGQSAAVWIAVRAPSGLWGPFEQTGGTVQFNASGVATYPTPSARATWISIRIYLPIGSPPVPETWSAALQARWR